MEYILHLANLCLLYCALAQSLNLVFGLGKLLNLAHISAYGLGAYTLALLTTRYDITSPFLCLALSTAVGALFGVVLSAVATRLDEDYFALGTLALSALVNAVLTNYRSLTNGVLGIAGIPRPQLLGLNFDELRVFLFFTGAVSFLILAVLYCVWRSHLGRLLVAQSEHHAAVMSLGHSVPYVRLLGIVISSGFAGTCGGLFAYYLSYIDPTSFGLHEMVFVLSAVVVGKPGSYWGCLAGTVFLVLLPEPLRFVQFPPEVVGPMRQLLYATILLLVIYLRRNALLPSNRRV